MHRQSYGNVSTTNGQFALLRFEVNDTYTAVQLNPNPDPILITTNEQLPASMLEKSQYILIEANE